MVLLIFVVWIDIHHLSVIIEIVTVYWIFWMCLVSSWAVLVLVFSIIEECWFLGAIITAGFYFIPGALSIEEQCQWIKESLTSFPQPPNRTNHNAVYGSIHSLFDAAKEHKVLVEDLDCKNNSCVSDKEACRWRFCEESVASSREHACKSISASVLLRKLRWSTLGLQFDWSKVITFLHFLPIYIAFDVFRIV